MVKLARLCFVFSLLLIPAFSKPLRALEDSGHSKSKLKWHYIIVPVKGTVGVEVTAKVLDRCLKIARAYSIKHKPTAIILEIDSPGGLVSELTSILAVLRKYDELRIIAYVRRAISAAAVLAMSCKEIISYPTGTIGGAVIYRTSAYGTYDNIDKKSGSKYKSLFFASVKAAKHNHLLLKGMMEADISLSLVNKKDGPHIIEGDKGKRIKERGKILTLTASEAVEYGLALGTCQEIKNCNTLLNTGSWKKLPNHKIQMIINYWKRHRKLR